MADKWITIMGSFVADLAFRTTHVPAWGETLMGSAFKLGPGGKGSNQAVAAARLGGRVTFMTKLAHDAFGQLARDTYKEEGINTEFLFESHDQPTGAAAIIIDEKRGENAIIVVPGACFHITREEVDKAWSRIAESAVFMTQLETQVPTVEHGLKVAHSLGVITVLNPAPATKLPATVYPACDYLTPNESEAAALTGMPVKNVMDGEMAAEMLLKRGARNVVITLGEKGALAKNAKTTEMVHAYDAGPVVETTGAGDAFAGGFAVALAEGRDMVEATRFGCAVAAISVTRPGTAPSMPKRAEVEPLLKKGPR
jgi:ribokinase